MGRIPIVAAPAQQPPFPVDVLAVEDDTYGVLAADPEFRVPTEHPIRIWTALHETEPAAPGSVVVRAGDPPRLHAIVHDLSQEPTCRPEWVAAALAEVLREVERAGYRSLGTVPLGSVHGRLRPERFLETLTRAVESEAPASLERIWLVLPPRMRGSTPG